MRHPILTLVVFLCWLGSVVTFCFAREDGPHQPYASYWFVDELLQWKPEVDPSAPFNKSITPLAPRFVQQASQRNAQQSTAPKIMALISAHGTSNHPSQGFPDSSQYVFPFWQYLDVLVMWGGSANEGLIVTPSVPWIDAAHRNGVKVFGTVFFPPRQYGGKIEWFRDLLKRDSAGNFPVADQLMKVADLYGFDGWFLNQETQGATIEDAKLMREFLAYYQRRAANRFQIIWYDSMVDTGQIAWQEELNDRNVMFFQAGGQRRSDLFFLDFGWNAQKLKNTAKRAHQVGRSQWDIFAGIDVQARSFRTPVAWPALYNQSQVAHTSIALYWPNSTKDMTQAKTLSQGYRADLKFWGGCLLEPPVHGLEKWQGFADYFPARSTISNIPFLTRFNYGAGDFYNEAGKQVSKQPWHNLSNQDLLPTWQWRTDPAKLRPTIDFSEAYYGGSCLRVDVTLDAQEIAYLPLYKTKLNLSSSSIAKVAARLASTDLKLSLLLTFAGAEKQQQMIPLELSKTDQWETVTQSLQSYAGSTIATLGLAVMASEKVIDQPFYIGELVIRDQEVRKPESPQVDMQTFFSDGKAELFLSFNNQVRGSADHIDIYEISSDKTRVWLGQAKTQRYYVPQIAQPAEGRFTELEFVRTNASGEVSPPTTIKVDWSKQ